MAEEERATFLVGGCRYVKAKPSFYPIYKADDMFRPLWAILWSQKYLMRRKYTVYEH